VTCGNGTNMSGTVTGSDFKLSGVYGGGSQGECSGGANPNSILVSCDGCTATVTCSFGTCGR
jgi:hypothetical protein